MEKDQHSAVFRISAIGLILSAIAVRLGLLFRSLQYDELWSWQFFSRLGLTEILFSLALPNNHPLNTLAIKLTCSLTDDIFAVRYITLLCGVLTIPLVYFVMNVWSSRRLPAAVAAAFTAFSAPLVVYSALARGYILQTFFFVLTAAGFACFSSDYAKKYSKTGFALIIIGGIGTILSVPTGVVFLAGLLFTIVLRYKKRPPKLMLAAIIAGVVIAGVYYMIAFDQLVSAQKWSTGGSYFIQCGKILFSTGCFSLLVLSLIGSLISPRKTLPLFAIPLTVLLSGAITGLGPERTYIIFAVVFACASGITIDTLANFKIKNGKKYPLSHIAAVLLFLAPFAHSWIFLRSWQLPDWKSADVKTPVSTICVYPANSGYPLLWNHGTDFISNYQNSAGKSYLDTLRVYAPNGVINGMDGSLGEKSVQTDLSGKRGEDGVLGVFHEYKLTPYTGTAPENSCFLIAYPLSATRKNSPENSLRLNPWFENSPAQNGSCALYFTRTPPAPQMGCNIFVISNY